MLSWLQKSMEERRGVVIAGSYGMGNAGDEATILAIAQDLRRIDLQLPLTVVSRKAKQTAKNLPGSALGISRLRLYRWLQAMGRARVFLLGGGSLLQDVTSSRNLWYYLTLLRLAKTLGCLTQLYGVGIGPIHAEKHRQQTVRYLNLYADAITVRDRESLLTLQQWGVQKPRLLLSADPVLSLPPLGGVREHKAAFIFRLWPAFGQHVPELAAMVQYVWRRYKLSPVFFCLAPEDRKAVRSVCTNLGDTSLPLQVTSDVRRISRMSAVFSIRLHGLIFALREGIPAAGISYDPKVDAFCREASLPCIDLQNVTEAGLEDLADCTMLLDGEHLSASARSLRARCQVSVNTAADLLCGDLSIL